MKVWLSLALRRDIVLRSIKVGLLVGTILVLINYFDKFSGSQFNRIDILKILLTYTVPYCVSTYASVSSIITSRKGHSSLS